MFAFLDKLIFGEAQKADENIKQDSPKDGA
jgi:hypothetical protein